MRNTQHLEIPWPATRKSTCCTDTASSQMDERDGGDQCCWSGRGQWSPSPLDLQKQAHSCSGALPQRKRSQEELRAELGCRQQNCVALCPVPGSHISCLRQLYWDNGQWFFATEWEIVWIWNTAHWSYNNRCHNANSPNNSSTDENTSFFPVSKKQPALPYSASQCPRVQEMLTTKTWTLSCLHQSLPICDQTRRDQSTPKRAQPEEEQREQQGYTGCSFVNPPGSLHWRSLKATISQPSPKCSLNPQQKSLPLSTQGAKRG